MIALLNNLLQNFLDDNLPKQQIRVTVIDREYIVKIYISIISSRLIKSTDFIQICLIQTK